MSSKQSARPKHPGRKTANPLRPVLPLGALAAGFGLATAALAQTTAPAAAPAQAPAQVEETLPVVRAKANAEKSGKDDYQATETRIGKGRQDIRDIPQSLTVITEKVMDDRKMDSVKDVLRNTSGITFQAAEGGEEDIKVHGISLQSTGDIFIDGMRDPAFYDRDTFFLDRIELLRGSASLLFGRGSTGGAVNQVLKPARLLDENQIDVTAGSHSALRVVGDFNKRTGENAALRVGVMGNTADSNGAGSSIDKKGIAGTYRWGIDEQDEFSATLFALKNDNGINYGVRWIRPTTALADAAAPPISDPVAIGTGTLVPIDPDKYYGLSSDYNHGSANFGMLSHTHRFSPNVELVSKVRYAEYTRDQRATLWNFAAGTSQPSGQTVSLETFGPNTVLSRGLQIKKQNMQTLTVQSDLSAKFNGLGLEHYLQTGVDLAREKKQVYAPVTALQGGVVPTKPPTTIGTPDDGASIDEGQRSFRPNNDYISKSVGWYVQDMVQVAPMWKVLGGLRYDYLKGKYNQYDSASTTAVYPLRPTVGSPYGMTVAEWSKRGAVLFQPDAQWSFHLMGATSFNTSGDAYSMTVANVGVPPEQTVNVELGGKFDTEDGRLSVRGGLFRNTKVHERNQDCPPGTVNCPVTLSGKRHAAGLDVDVLGRITPKWEIFANLTWMPIAKIDVSGASGNAERQGQRPSLSPKLSGTFWTTYQMHPQWRVGAGLNGRSKQTPNRNPGLASLAAPSFVKYDLMAEYTPIPDTLSLRLNVDNVTNKLYADQLYSSFYVPGPGRVVSLTASYKF